jgi:hypothetical protein
MKSIESPWHSVQTPGLALSLSELLAQYRRGLEAIFWSQVARKIAVGSDAHSLAVP